MIEDEWEGCLGLQAMPSCGVRSGVVVVMVLWPRRSTVWCGVTMSVVAAL
jgi:hypothetical protein